MARAVVVEGKTNRPRQITVHAETCSWVRYGGPYREYDPKDYAGRDDVFVVNCSHCRRGAQL